MISDCSVLKSLTLLSVLILLFLLMSLLFKLDRPKNCCQIPSYWKGRGFLLYLLFNSETLSMTRKQQRNLGTSSSSEFCTAHEKIIILFSVWILFVVKINSWINITYMYIMGLEHGVWFVFRSVAEINCGLEVDDL